MKHKPISILSLLPAILLAACQTRGADDYLLDDITASMAVRATGDGRVSVQATFQPSSDPLVFLMLARQDALTARIGTRARQMGEQSLLGMVSYLAEFKAVPAESLAEISLARARGNVAAISTVYIPAAVADLAASAHEVSRGDPLTVCWTLPDRQIDDLDLIIAGNCIKPYSRALSPGDTSFTIPAHGLEEDGEVWAGTASPTCRISVTIVTSRDGLLSPEFGGGIIRATSETSIALTSRR